MAPQFDYQLESAVTNRSQLDFLFLVQFLEVEVALLSLQFALDFVFAALLSLLSSFLLAASLRIRHGYVWV